MWDPPLLPTKSYREAPRYFTLLVDRKGSNYNTNLLEMPGGSQKWDLLPACSTGAFPLSRLPGCGSGSRKAPARLSIGVAYLNTEGIGS